MDGAPACPFVAFDDDREGRSTSPDHRHRCFAESPPAPRALAHQEAYCLSSAFPVCPTFQDWARREAAHARGAGERAETAPTAVAAAAPLDRHAVGRRRATSRRGSVADDAPAVRRTARRAQPAARLGGAAAVGDEARRRRACPGVRRRLRPAGAAAPSRARVWPGAPRTGSPAARSRRRPRGRRRPPGRPRRPEPGVRRGRRSGRVWSSRRPVPAPPSRPPTDPSPPSTGTGRRPAVSSTRPTGDAIPGPPWERMRRYEAYPTIKTRAGLPGMPGLPRLGLLAAAIGIAALALFMLPALLGIGGGGGIRQPGSQRQPAGRHGQAVAHRAAGADAAGLRDQGRRHPHEDRQEVRRHARRAAGRQPGPSRIRTRSRSATGDRHPASSRGRDGRRHPDLPRRRLERSAVAAAALARRDVDRGDLARLDPERRVDVLALRARAGRRAGPPRRCCRCRGSRPGSCAGPLAAEEPAPDPLDAAQRLDAVADVHAHLGLLVHQRDRALAVAARSASRRSLPSSRQHPWAECTVGRPWTPAMTLTDAWPLFGLRLRTTTSSCACPTDDDLPALLASPRQASTHPTRCRSAWRGRHCGAPRSSAGSCSTTGGLARRARPTTGRST